LIVALKEYFPNADYIEASNGKEVVELTKSTNPDIILLDIIMPYKNGIQTLIELKQKNVSSKIAMLSAKSSKEFIFIAKKYEANGYFTKHISPEMLAEAMLRIATSNLFICTEWFSLEFKKNNEFIESLLLNLKLLSKQEKEVLKWFFQAYNTKEVAEKLNVKMKSVDNYKNRISKKMDFPKDMYFQDWVRKYGEFIRLIVE
jgi:DNA-binding NarL/FixJ family response regulator